jgi:hypothetical protein
MSGSISSNSSGNLELYSGSTKILTADAVTGVANFVNAPTAPTPTAGTNNTQLATTAFAMGAGIGSNQSWQDVSSNRSLGVTYTNNTGKPILVYFRCLPSGTSEIGFTLNGNLTIFSTASNNSSYIALDVVLVPNNYTYSVFLTNSATASNIKWVELR